MGSRKHIRAEKVKEEKVKSKKKIIKTPLKFNPGQEQFEPDLEKIKEIPKEEKKQGFFSKIVHGFSTKISEEEFAKEQ